MAALTINDLPYFDDKPEGFYRKYDNYDALNIDHVADIPIDYEGVMGVPLTIFDKDDMLAHMEIIGSFNDCKVNGTVKYARIFIRWVFKEQIRALKTKSVLRVRGAYHAMALWCETMGIKLEIESKQKNAAREG